MSEARELLQRVWGRVRNTGKNDADECWVVIADPGTYNRGDYDFQLRELRAAVAEPTLSTPTPDAVGRVVELVNKLLHEVNGANPAEFYANTPLIVALAKTIEEVRS